MVDLLILNGYEVNHKLPAFDEEFYGNLTPLNVALLIDFAKDMSSINILNYLQDFTCE